SIDVTPVNDRPTALASGVETVSGVPVPVILKGEDIDGDTLSFRIVRGPSNGRLVGKAPGLTYEPASSFAGTDSFDFVVSDGREESSPARVTIHVAGGNRAPVAFGWSIQVKEDASVAVKRNAKDDGGDPLTYRISRAPAKGKLSGKAPSLTYTPAPDFNGADSFDFEVSDGKLSSAATVSIKVLPVN